MGKNRGLAAFISLLLVCSALLSACSDKAASSGQTNTDAKQTIRIGYQKNGPLFILKNQGNLEKRLQPLGVSVEWFEFPSGPPVLESLNAGSIDLGRTGDAPPIFAQAAGSSLVYVGVGKPKSKGTGFLVKKDSAIRSLQDLKGKTIGFSKGSSSHYFLVKVLGQAGLNLTDIKPAYLTPGDGRIAFEQGNIDAWIVWDPFTADAERSADARVLISGEGLTSDRDFFLASAEYAKNHGDIIRIVLEEVQKSCDWANQNQGKLADLLSSLLGIDKASMEMAIERREYGLDEMNEEIMEEQQEVAGTFYDLKIIPEKVNVKERFFMLPKKEVGK
ncbi:sulfonate ABC transporter substrate-binding protein [Paenibacillus caui]|uniref:sulfonate ABC transporter substrate-binding protein n=1 Tax=Paenibacillus caui TaxID=2873927 RepID=UPI001F2BDBF4|nr:sulfonate ABC transporter substrate-binding protein [Paenibacillus caui]